MQPGNPRSACAKGSRWHRFAFAQVDQQKRIRVANKRVLVDGLLRTDIDPTYFQNGINAPGTCTDQPTDSMAKSGETCAGSKSNWLKNRCRNGGSAWTELKACQQTCYDNGVGYTGDDCSAGWAALDYDGFICSLEEAVGGTISLSLDSTCIEPFTTLPNPGIWFADANLYPDTGRKFESLRPGVLLLAESHFSCDNSNFTLTGGHYYMHDSRLELVQNTLESPASSTANSCPAVPRTFLNEGSCRLQAACTPLNLQKTLFQLNETNLQKFHSVESKFLYSIVGLRTSVSPCGTLSRWKKLAACSVDTCSGTVLSTADADAVRSHLQAEDGWLRDIAVDCSAVPANAIIQAGTEFFQHVHLHEHNVYDFSEWVNQHPGGMHHITKWASLNFEISFPGHHAMTSWEAGSTQNMLQYIGRAGDTIDFQDLPTSLQSETLAAAFNSVGENDYFEVCGSPGEVGNAPENGNQLSFYSHFQESQFTDLTFDNPNKKKSSDRHAKTTVWTMKALTANDQLRQRMAWALAQIFVAGIEGFGNKDMAEMWITYYDIFVRNAFQNFRDVLREVTYSPLMGAYLTYKKNSAYDHNNKYPDENYAREIMQLFTIGLYELHQNGSRILDGRGEAVSTYDNEHVMNFARVFTGFDEQLPRANIEKMKGSQNQIDPMRMRAEWHDVYPKPDLQGNYLGDGYPLCADLPVQSFLLKGAKYRFLGFTYDGSNALVLAQESGLYGALCAGHPVCNFALSVELNSSLACHGSECNMDAARILKVSNGFYEYVPPTCVHLFFSNGQVTAPGASNLFDRESKRKCSNPDTAVAGTACCSGCGNIPNNWIKDNGLTCENATAVSPAIFTNKCNGDSNWRKHKFCALECWKSGVGYEGDDCSAGEFREKRVCSFQSELFRFEAARSQCAKIGMDICPESTAAADCGYDEMQVWTGENCSSASVAVHADGKITVQTDENTKQNPFAVQWQAGFPTAGTCPQECEISNDACVCPTRVETQSVFHSIPSEEELHSKLRAGAFAPTTTCTFCDGSVKAYTVGGLIDEKTVFECKGRFFRNVESLVHLGTYAFRNPPVFMLRESPTSEAALAEVESLLDHLFYHANTPVFIAHRLIQRFGISNPSATYIQDVGEAFRTGAHLGRVYSGKYGDLAATAAAILLHPEARNQDSSDTQGSLREPIIKVMHFMRAMEYVDNDEKREVVLKDIEEVIGQAPYNSPSVFNFYQPDFQPASFSDGVVAPEFQIYTAPWAVGLLNGLISLIQHGLTSCEKGFGLDNCEAPQGVLTLNSTGIADEAVAELDILLTGGRLGSESKKIVQDAYDETSEADRFKVLQQAFVMMPEFHTLGNPQPDGQRAAAVSAPIAEPTSYKAIVLLFMSGGADTFNMIVPYDCPLYEEYKQVRADMALQPHELAVINTTGQACSKFAVHHKFPFLKELYEKKQAAFVSNIGSLVEPTTKEQFKNGGRRCVGLFSHSDQQQAAHTLKCQTPGASPRGAGGRIADALKPSFRTNSFSITGSHTWPQGFQTNYDIIDKKEGVVRLERFDQLKTVLNNITSQKHKNVYCEEYAKQLAAAVESSENLGSFLNDAQLEHHFAEESTLGKQLHQVARLIKTRQDRKVERDFFVVDIGGFDAHSNAAETLALKFEQIDNALRDFVTELQAQDIFNSTVLVSESDFGRSLTSNGAGTDHAWAGNHFVLGGNVNGGRVFNDFPSSLLEGNDQDAGRGRLIPKYPWDNVMVPLAQWMGVQEPDLTSVFPNLGNFDAATHIISKDSLFSA